MAFLATWNITQLPKAMVDILEEDIKEYDKDVDTSKLLNDKEIKSIRNSKNTWITTEHWIGGFLWYYIQKVNNENFCYDLIDIDGGSVQYTHYGPGEYYNWHQDGDIDVAYKPQLQASSGSNISQDIINIQGECIRKLSFTLQLSDMDEYTGGEVEFMDASDKVFLAPKQRGTLIVFDSRVKHRVRKVKTGLRKSLVGWVVGPRWK